MWIHALSLTALLCSSSIAFAQSTTEDVHITIGISQPSLFASDSNDVFKGTVDDRTGTTTLEVTCSAGASAWLGLSRIDEACAVAGNGAIKNPNNPAQTLPRIGYSGGFTVEAGKDGYTDVSTILANYLRAGAAGAENSSFKGNVVMKPENPSASALALGNSLIKKLEETATGTTKVKYDTAIDSVRFEGFTVPNVGLVDSKSCVWTGDAIYAYANDAWQMQFDVKCGDKSYKLEGNMPLVDAPAGSDHQQEYALNLVLPGAGGGDPFAAADPFASVDGITGTIGLTNSGRATDHGVYEKVQVEGDLKGVGVPTELVRGFGEIMVIFARTFYGA
ncbi:MAG: hypothetical protein WAT09_13385 [Paracoccaceae bacterium]